MSVSKSQFSRICYCTFIVGVFLAAIVTLLITITR